jgi:Protein of unknown function (DUF3592)
VIKINKLYGYLIGLVLTLIIYFIGQLIFFINTDSVQGQICDITTKTSGSRYRGRVEIYYACFTTNENINVKFRVGSNLQYDYGDTVKVIYKKNNPHTARLSGFTELWAMPVLYYLIPFALIMAAVKAIYYGNRYVVINKKPFRMSTFKNGEDV